MVISDADDIAGVYAIRMIGALMAKDDAAEDTHRQPLQATFDEIAAKSEKSGKTIYFEVFPAPVGAVDGRKRHVHGRAGDDVRRDQRVCGCSGWQSDSEEQVIERNPDYIVYHHGHRRCRGGDHGPRRLGRYRRGEERPGL